MNVIDMEAKVKSSSVIRELVGGGDELLAFVSQAGIILQGSNFSLGDQFHLDHINPLKNVDPEHLKLNRDTGYVTIDALPTDRGDSGVSSTRPSPPSTSDSESTSPRLLFHYTNIQPLSPTANCSKGACFTSTHRQYWRKLQTYCNPYQTLDENLQGLVKYNAWVTSEGLQYGAFGLCDLEKPKA